MGLWAATSPLSKELLYLGAQVWVLSSREALLTKVISVFTRFLPPSPLASILRGSPPWVEQLR